ncbi:ribokinase [Microbacterium sp. RD1]|uniref:ribokinase n=1 Tax=Microbacterium sp. RD1 TaxID=3457313 RepID=UPI003FA5384F
MAGSDDSRGRLLVAGAIHIDESFRVPRLPAAGETVIATALARSLGGKAANQAIAARRAGAAVTLLGAVGDDADGTQATDELAARDVSTTLIQRLPGARTDRAVIFVDPAGENAIVVHPVAAEALDQAAVARALSVAPRAGVVLVQGEVPPDNNLEVVAHAVETGARLVVNLAPFFPPSGPFAQADPMILNEVEAAELAGAAISGPADVVTHASLLLRHCQSAVVTLGGEGAVVVAAGKATHVPAVRVAEIVDTTGAGDTFAGTLAARLALGDDLITAASQGVLAASRTVGHFGPIAPDPITEAAVPEGVVPTRSGVK